MNIQNKGLLLLIFLLTNLSCSTDIDSNWRGPERNGKYLATGLLSEWSEEGPPLLWRCDSLNMGFSSPAVTQKAIYVTGMTDSTNGFLYCLDLNGELVWRARYGDEYKTAYTGSRSTPVVSGNELYLVSGAGELICFDLKRHQRKWTRSLPENYRDSLPTYGHAQSPLIDGNRLYYVSGSLSENIICLNRKSGKMIWSSPGMGKNATYSSPIMANHNGNRIIIAVTEEEIMGLSADKGILLWHIICKPLFVNHINTPLYYRGKIYMAANSINEQGEGIIAIEMNQDGTEASVLWQRKDIRNLLSGIIINNDRLYTAVYRKKEWFMINPSNGQTIAQWEGPMYGNITISDDHFYLLSADGQVSLCKESDSGLETVSSFKMDIQIWDPFGPLWGFPVIMDKVLYIRHKNSLFAYDIAEK